MKGNPTKHFQELRQLINEMEQEEIAIFPCEVTYKRRHYIALIGQLEENKKYQEYDFAYIKFINLANTSETLEVLVNDFGFHSEVKGNEKYLTRQLITFFNIDSKSGKYGTGFQTLYLSLSSQFPTHYTPVHPRFNAYVLDEIGRQSSDNPANKIYCNHVKRLGKKKNGEQMHRSSYNSQKANILRHELYQHLKEDRTVSFYFYEDKNMEKTDAEILKQFAKNKGIN